MLFIRYLRSKENKQKFIKKHLFLRIRYEILPFYDLKLLNTVFVFNGGNFGCGDGFVILFFAICQEEGLQFIIMSGARIDLDNFTLYISKTISVFDLKFLLWDRKDSWRSQLHSCELLLSLSRKALQKSEGGNAMSGMLTLTVAVFAAISATSFLGILARPGIQTSMTGKSSWN